MWRRYSRLNTTNMKPPPSSSVWFETARSSCARLSFKNHPPRHFPALRSQWQCLPAAASVYSLRHHLATLPMTSGVPGDRTRIPVYIAVTSATRRRLLWRHDTITTAYEAQKFTKPNVFVVGKSVEDASEVKVIEKLLRLHITRALQYCKCLDVLFSLQYFVLQLVFVFPNLFIVVDTVKIICCLHVNGWRCLIKQKAQLSLGKTCYNLCKPCCSTDLQGHSRSMIFILSEKAYATSYSDKQLPWPSFLTFPRYMASLPLKNANFSYPPPQPQIWKCFSYVRSLYVCMPRFKTHGWLFA